MLAADRLALVRHYRLAFRSRIAHTLASLVSSNGSPTVSTPFDP